MKNMTAVYFSPTGGTKEACMVLVSAMSQDVERVDFCIFGWEWTSGPGDVAIVGIPVFGGRIPGLAAEKFRHCRGDGAAVVTAMVYGSRVFEDALSESDDCLRVQGSRIAAGTALPVEYPIVGDIASGRPDEQDMGDIRSSTVRILDKLQEEGWQESQVPESHSYRDQKQMLVAPVTNDSRTARGRCVKPRPVRAIPLDTPDITKAGQCILCMCCVSVYPTQVGSLPVPALLMLKQKLSSVRDIRRENELFLQAYLSGLLREPALKVCSESLPYGLNPG